MIQDKLSRYLRHLDSQDQEEMNEKDFYLNRLRLEGLNKQESKQKKR